MAEIERGTLDPIDLENLHETFEVAIIVKDKRGIKLLKSDGSSNDKNLIPIFTVKHGELNEKVLRSNIEKDYGVKPKKFESIGVVRDSKEIGKKIYTKIRRVFLVTELEEGVDHSKVKSKYKTTSLKKALETNTDEISQRILRLVERSKPQKRKI